MDRAGEVDHPYQIELFMGFGSTATERRLKVEAEKLARETRKIPWKG
jgi:hypothetical protein